VNEREQREIRAKNRYFSLQKQKKKNLRIRNENDL